MRAYRYLQQLVHLVRRLLHWLQLDTRAGWLELLSLFCLVRAVQSLGHEQNGQALLYWILYLYFRK